MKATSPLFTAVLIALTLASAYEAATLAGNAPPVQAAQAAQATPPAGIPSQQPGGSPPPPKSYPAPTNLKVLPKNLTGEQVHEIMEQWESALGAHCRTCHTQDPNKIGPNGKPMLDFADDSKKEKETARLMFTMTGEINRNYISKFENSGAPVTCGSCHRGHLGPEPFVPPAEKKMPPAAAPAK
jgi:hypothetical protein